MASGTADSSKQPREKQREHTKAFSKAQEPEIFVCWLHRTAPSDLTYFSEQPRTHHRHQELTLEGIPFPTARFTDSR